LTDDTTTLTVLEALAESADLPQRQLAARTGLNLAKVNFVLRALKDRGWVKLKKVRDNPHKLKYLYLLTPEGLAAKSQLAYRFVQRTLRQYADVEQKVTESVADMAAKGVHRVVLWGCTEITELCTRVMGQSDDGLRVVGVIDPCGLDDKALAPDQFAALEADAVVVCQAEASDLPAGVEVFWLI
jgi:EPS-associated MarR family transcriptional regulator